MNSEKISPPGNLKLRSLVLDILLLIIIAGAAFLRLTGLYWGEYSYMHPDERFLIWVGTDITPMACDNPDVSLAGCPPEDQRWMSLGEYFNSENSTLNPQNRGHTFFVYGTLPMFLTRVVVQWIYGHSGFDEMTNVGRALSAFIDLLSVFVVYLIGKQIYNRRVGLLGAAFLAVTVMHIQQSHFFTMDTFITFFTILSLYFAVNISMDKREWIPLSRFWKHPLFFPSLLFGLALGMAVASKLNAFLMAGMLPVAVLVRLAQFPSDQRIKRGLEALPFIVLAALTSLLAFRIFQPYAFTGPGFFDLKLNSEWLDSVRALYGQQRNPDIDFPPQMQWARRPIWFSAQNMILWGLGLPLGILSFSGFLWAGWRILRSFGRDQEWQHHFVIWFWTALYFGYQSLAPNPTMRYQMPVYPTFVILAAWAVVALWDLNAKGIGKGFFNKPRLKKIIALSIGILVLLLTIGWAFAFTQIYVQPFTRVDASRWIMQNIPGPVNISLQTEDGVYIQPIPFPMGTTISPITPFQTSFRPKVSGTVSEIFVPNLDQEGDSQLPLVLEGAIYENPGQNNLLASGKLVLEQGITSQISREGYTITLDSPIPLLEEHTYYLVLSVPGEKSFDAFVGNMNLTIEPLVNDTPTGEGQAIAIVDSAFISPDYPFRTAFTPPSDSLLTGVTMSEVNRNPDDNVPPLSISILQTIESQDAQSSDLVLVEDSDNVLRYNLSEPIKLAGNQEYILRLSARSFQEPIMPIGSTIANEGDWDDGLPLRIDGFDPYGGIYPPDKNLNMYWEDNLEKVDRFLRILDESDYIVISSNRQWGTLPRIPERFPMTTLYYRNLLGCPPEQDIVDCYRVATPGKYQGQLGFELVKTIQSNPKLGSFEINDQFAEEAFTVYDHPKVLIFKKTAAYDSEKVRSLLGSVDFSKIISMPPLRYESYPQNLLLPLSRWFEQRLGGTWSELFNTRSLVNRWPFITVLVWYFAIFILGLVAFPIVRFALPGLSDRAYPLARIAGLLLLSYFVWLAGSFRIPVTRTLISFVFLFLVLISAGLTYLQRKELVLDWRKGWRYFLSIEGIFLAFFILDLLIRIGNPDLWHPYKGGEKPMDFAYFNAVLKSTSFPPYDPWYSGGFLNYYYYGFVLFGVFVKWLGVVPAVAYNLILPTVFAMIALGAFSIAWNLFHAASPKAKVSLKYLSGLSGALSMAVLGNLGTVKMIWQGYQKLAAGGISLESLGFFSRIALGFRGFAQTLGGSSLPYSLGDWYWIPSRAIPPQGDVEPITEFPFFTVLYADPHAHLFSLPLALLALSFVVSIVLSKGRWKTVMGTVAGFILGGLVIGALRPTNTWDFPLYLALGVVALIFSIISHYAPSAKLLDTVPILERLPLIYLRLITAFAAVVCLIGVSFLSYLPYSSWYALGYTQVKLWEGPLTPMSAYLIHWGLFLFVIISWIIWEFRDWLEKTPVSSLRKLERNAVLIAVSAAIFLFFTIFLAIKVPGLDKLPLGKGVQIAWLVLPVAAVAGLLLFRSSQPDAKKIVLFLIGTGLFLTLMVEVIVLVGDIGRMNTVFKFYLQVWTLFAVSSAAALGWLVESFPGWSVNWKKIWLGGLTVLVLGASLYPLLAGTAKVKDRMVSSAPHTLDGMEYMNYASYDWQGSMDLSEDYAAIRWMQENIQGSPVIVEANMRDLYRWGSRFSIYTGLPSVVGWEWHQIQQRAINPASWVNQRVDEVDEFYKTTNIEKVIEFLRKYEVRYIVIGQLEKNIYPLLSLRKFEQENGKLWNLVYQEGNTSIYEVIPQP